MNHPISETDMLHLAEEAGFRAAMIDVKDMVFDAGFRKYCEVNYCGDYGANYSCPPDSGTPEEMWADIAAHNRAMVLQTKWKIEDYRDNAAILSAKRQHNAYALHLESTLRARGCTGLMTGAGSCALCDPCLKTQGQPCRYPEKRLSCLSAYCVYVKILAERCGMEYFCADGSLAFFSVFAFD